MANESSEGGVEFIYEEDGSITARDVVGVLRGFGFELAVRARYDSISSRCTSDCSLP